MCGTWFLPLFLRVNCPRRARCTPLPGTDYGRQQGAAPRLPRAGLQRPTWGKTMYGAPFVNELDRTNNLPTTVVRSTVPPASGSIAVVGASVRRLGVPGATVLGAQIGATLSRRSVPGASSFPAIEKSWGTGFRRQRVDKGSHRLQLLFLLGPCLRLIVDTGSEVPNQSTRRSCCPCTSKVLTNGTHARELLKEKRLGLWKLRKARL